MIDNFSHIVIFTLYFKLTNISITDKIKFFFFPSLGPLLTSLYQMYILLNLWNIHDIEMITLNFAFFHHSLFLFKRSIHIQYMVLAYYFKCSVESHKYITFYLSISSKWSILADLILFCILNCTKWKFLSALVRMFSREYLDLLN